MVRVMGSLFTRVGFLGALAISGAAAIAQTPPTPAESSAYRGLHAAAVRGSDEDLRRLAQAGADPRISDRNGATPLQLAQARGYTGMVSLLQRASPR